MLEIRPVSNEDGGYRMDAFEGAVMVGTAVYRLDGKLVRISFVEASDDAVADGLVRAALNDAGRKGAEWAEGIPGQAGCVDINKALSGSCS